MTPGPSETDARDDVTCEELTVAILPENLDVVYRFEVSEAGCAGGTVPTAATLVLRIAMAITRHAVHNAGAHICGPGGKCIHEQIRHQVLAACLGTGVSRCARQDAPTSSRISDSDSDSSGASRGQRLLTIRIYPFLLRSREETSVGEAALKVMRRNEIVVLEVGIGR
jgi:hypothetical protein